jgi:hypothetical protein
VSEFGAFPIEPFEVSRWRGVPRLTAYGFSIAQCIGGVDWEAPTRCMKLWQDGRMRRMWVHWGASCWMKVAEFYGAKTRTLGVENHAPRVGLRAGGYELS